MPFMHEGECHISPFLPFLFNSHTCRCLA